MSASTEKTLKGWHEKFLQLLATGLSIAEAAKGAGVDRSTAYNHKYKHKDFAERWEEALEACMEELESTAYKRANETSDTLVMFLLKAHNRAKYGDKVHVDVNDVTVDMLEEGRKRAANKQLPDDCK